MGRRGVGVGDEARWVFNRLAADYARRPGYPEPLVARLAGLARGGRAADLGAGTGRLAFALAGRGLEVDAVEPARAMLAQAPAHPRLHPVHAPAESTGLPSGTHALALLADAAHWVDPELAGREVARLLAPGGALAVVDPRLADTPFLRDLEALLAAANPKARPGRRDGLAQLFALATGAEPRVERFEDEVALSPEDLDAVLRSFSHVGPALAPERLAALLAGARALAGRHGGAVWRRDIALFWARRG